MDALRQWAPQVGTSASGIQPSRSFDSAATDRVLALDALSHTVARNNGELAECVASVRDIADSIFGVQPETTGKDSNLPPTSARIDGLSRNVSTTGEIIDVLRRQIERLRAI